MDFGRQMGKYWIGLIGQESVARFKSDESRLHERYHERTFACEDKLAENELYGQHGSINDWSNQCKL